MKNVKNMLFENSHQDFLEMKSKHTGGLVALQTFSNSTSRPCRAHWFSATLAFERGKRVFKTSENYENTTKKNLMILEELGG